MNFVVGAGANHFKHHTDSLPAYNGVPQLISEFSIILCATSDARVGLRPSSWLPESSCNRFFKEYADVYDSLSEQRFYSLYTFSKKVLEYKVMTNPADEFLEGMNF